MAKQKSNKASVKEGKPGSSPDLKQVSPRTERTSLTLHGVRENNLKNLSLEVPHDQLVVLTGLSGSGKSSLAFDTVYAEGQRRYIETFSPYTRQFLDRVKRPSADSIEHVRPAIAIQQRTRIMSSRSSVGSLTGIHDYLKLLWSHLASPSCPDCGIDLESYSPDRLTDTLTRLAAFKPRSSFLLCFTARMAAGENVLERLQALGFSRIFTPADGDVSRLEDLSALPDEYLVVVDRFTARSTSTKDGRTLLHDAISQAFTSGVGECSVVEIPADSRTTRPLLRIENNSRGRNDRPSRFGIRTYSIAPACTLRPLELKRPRPALFSYNHPLGACPECNGFGKVLATDTAHCIPDVSKTIAEGAIQCWTTGSTKSENKKLLKFCAAKEIPTDVPWRSLDQAHRDLLLNYNGRGFTGVLPWFKYLETKKYKMYVRIFLAKYRSQVECPVCRGTRLKPEALAYTIRERSIPEVWSMTVAELGRWLDETRMEIEASAALPRRLAELFDSIRSRLRYLSELGLDYLSLDRQSRTLSGGETQRVNLTSALGSGLVSTQFVLDEPSVGLHARDTKRLISAVQDLTNHGNSVMVVEHDPEFIESADHIVELGPESGDTGGTIVFAGSREKWDRRPLDAIPRRVNADPKPPGTEALVITNASSRNLSGFSTKIPLNRLVCLTGVSGGGKTTLVTEVLLAAHRAWKQGEPHIDKDVVLGFEKLDQVIMVDQSPLAKSPRANVATYSKMWDPIRELLASTDAARTRALGKSSFSFNVDAGRCPACSGAGFVREDMQFLSDVYIPCELCLGKRFQQAVLEVTYEGHSVSDFLDMDVTSCRKLLGENTFIANTCKLLEQLGLGHIRLGHPLSELSGGEAQRLKLVPFVQQSGAGSSLLIFDEPTTGLHVRDTARLLELFKFLLSSGHSILCVEHNLPLISQADWIIDLGPEGGVGGGELMYEGPPAGLVADPSRCHTARELARYLSDAPAEFARPAVRPRSRSRHDAIEIRGAREHNLKHVDLDLPLGSVVALTGASGSGKSTIAKDIVYAEGQRRYLDCLSPYARQFIKELRRPDLDSIDNIPPTICVYQHTFQPSALSTVATMSEVYNYLRLLFAKAGTQYCPDHPSSAISSLSADAVAEELRSLGSKPIKILAPVIKLKKGTHKAVLERALESEIHEVRVDGIFGKPSQFSDLEKRKSHSIDFVVATCKPAQMNQEHLLDGIRQALSLGAGTLLVHTGGGEDLVFSIERTCPVCKRGFFKPDPEDLSFNSRRGVCSSCSGTGLDRTGNKPCSTCGGARLGPQGRAVRLGDRTIHDLCRMNPSSLKQFLETFAFSGRVKRVVEPILAELVSKLTALEELGLEYLELGRDCRSLSGGELQRLRLASAMGSSLAGVLYIFDEPSIGLHPRDNAKVIDRIRVLGAAGNSVVMIEHDPQSILSCDHIIEVGPGGGSNGGRIVFNGPVGNFLKEEESPTAQAIRLVPEERIPEELPPTAPALHVSTKGKNNVGELDLRIPLNQVIGVAGVSGAGKSSLVHGIIADTMLEGRSGKGGWSRDGHRVKSDIEIARVLYIDQRPIGQNSRSTPVSYLGILDDLRNIFAGTIDAKTRGWTKSSFSYNTSKGQCPECKGNGEITLEMSFLPDAKILCEACNGGRFREEVLSITYLGLTIAEVLKLTIDEARTKFINHRKVHTLLRRACELGLGYLTLGQSSTTLSGGESQRLKLVTELGTRRMGHTLYVLDEPTTGLHKTDVVRLVTALRDLVEQGHSVIIIEHDSDVLLRTDHLIELGPGPGAAGGKIIFQGHPNRLRDQKTPWGEVLRSGESAAPVVSRRLISNG